MHLKFGKLKVVQSQYNLGAWRGFDYLNSGLSWMFYMMIISCRNGWWPYETNWWGSNHIYTCPVIVITSHNRWALDGTGEISLVIVLHLYLKGPLSNFYHTVGFLTKPKSKSNKTTICGAYFIMVHTAFPKNMVPDVSWLRCNVMKYSCKGKEMALVTLV